MVEVRVAELLLVDAATARRVALGRGLRALGTGEILVQAKLARLLGSVGEVLDVLAVGGLRMSDTWEARGRALVLMRGAHVGGQGVHAVVGASYTDASIAMRPIGMRLMRWFDGNATVEGGTQLPPRRGLFLLFIESLCFGGSLLPQREEADFLLSRLNNVIFPKPG
jgi:hypothetical protein